MMLADDSPPMPPHSPKTPDTPPTISISSKDTPPSTVGVGDAKGRLNKSPTPVQMKSASLPRSTSANRMPLVTAKKPGGAMGGASSGPTHKKTVSSSISTGRLQSTRGRGGGGTGGGANSRKLSARN